MILTCDYCERAQTRTRRLLMCPLPASGERAHSCACAPIAQECTAFSDIGRSEIMECLSRLSALFRLDIARPDHLGPLLGFFSEVRAEFGGRERKHGAADISKPHLYLGVGEGCVYFLVQLVD